MKLKVFFVLTWMICSPVQASDSAAVEKDAGDAWADMGNWKKAVEHYHTSLKSNPNQPEVQLRLVNGLYLLGQKKQALDEILELGRTQSESAAVACATGVLLLDMDRVDEACRSFDRAISIDAKHARSVFGKAQCLQARFVRNQKPIDKQQSLDWYGKYLAMSPDGPHSVQAKEQINKLQYGPLGMALAEAKNTFAAGKFRLAETQLRKILQQQNDFEEAHYLLGMVLSSPVINQLQAANDEWKKAPHSKEALLQRGIYAFGEEELAQAIDFLQKAIDIDSNFPEPHYQLGLVFREQMKDAEARREFEKVKELAPGTSLAEQANSKLQLLIGQVMYLREGEVIDAASEIEIGKKITNQLEQQYGLFQEPKLQERLDKILRRITANSDRLPEATPYKVKLVNIDGINALSFTGGTIYIFKGLIDFVRQDLGDADDMYAIVLGHEVAHISLRHGLGMLDLAGGAQHLLSGEPLNVNSLNHLMLGMSRKHEFEADQMGSLYAYRAGFDPAAALRFHRSLLANGKEVPEGLDHPTHEERADRSREYLLGLRTKARHFEAGVQSLDRQDYENAMVHFEIFMGLFPQSLAAKNNLALTKYRLATSLDLQANRYKLSTDVDPRPNIQSIRLRSGTTDQRGQISPYRTLIIEAAEMFRSLANRDPSYLPARLNLSSCLIALDQPQEAMGWLKKILLEQPESSAAKNNLAVAMLQAKDVKNAIRALREVVTRHPEFADAYYNLALALQQQGELEGARKIWLAYLAKDATSAWAEQARSHLTQIK